VACFCLIWFSYPKGIDLIVVGLVSLE